MQMRRIREHKGWAAAAAVLLLVMAGAVVGLRGSDTPAQNSSTAVAGGAAPDVAPALAPTSAQGSADAKAQIAPVPPDPGTSTVVPGSPRIVKTADMRVQVGKGGFGAAFDRVSSIATANGGFVSSSSSASGDDAKAAGARSGDLTVRVPADRFDAVRQALGGLGKVASQSIRGEDVSGQLVDVDARIKNLQAQEDALRTLLGQAKAVGDVLSVQSNLFGVRQQIEQLKAQQANLTQATTLATIQVSLFEPGAATVPTEPVPDRSLAHSFHRAVDGMVAVAGGMVVVVGWLVPVAALGLVGWGASRVFRRRPAAQVPVT
jgi:hypothetical protein